MEIGSLRYQLKAVEKEKGEALEEVGKLSEEGAKLQQRVRELEEEKDAALVEQASLTSKLESTIKRQAATVYVQMGDALCREKKLQTTIAALQKKVQAAESQQERLKLLEIKIAELERKAACNSYAFGKESEEAKLKIDTLQNQVTAAKEQLGASSTMLSRLSTESTRKDHLIADLTQRNSQQELELAEIRNQVQALQGVLGVWGFDVDKEVE